MKNDEFRGIFVLRPLLSILQPLGRRTKIQSSAESEKEIYQNMNSNLRKLKEEFRGIPRIRGG